MPKPKRPKNRGVQIHNGIWEPTIKHFFAMVKLQCRDLGINNSELAQMLQVDPATITKMFDDGTANIIIISILCDELKIDITELTSRINARAMKEL